MIKYLCDECGKELKIMFRPRMEPKNFVIGLKHEDGTLIVAKIESMNKPPDRIDTETKEAYGELVKHICSECLAKKISESAVALII